MSTNSAETQFSIYKIDFDAVESVFSISGQKETTQYIQNVTKCLINSVCSIIDKKAYSQIQRIKYGGFTGVIFKTVHAPAWKSVAVQILNKNEEEDLNHPSDFLSNTNVSYILLYTVGTKMFACTGGYGSNYISKFIVKNYGLYLLPKLIDRNHPVIKGMIQNNLVGNQASTNKVNRKSTAISVEQDMSSIFRQIKVEAERALVEDIGIEFDENESNQKKIGLVNKDSFIVRRSISLSELTVLLSNLAEIEEKEDSFVLNYMVLARKKGIKSSELLEKMISDFCEDDYSKFVLVGDEYEQYYSNASKYYLTNENDDILLNQSEPIELADVFPLLRSDDGKITKLSIRKMLKQWQISTADNSGAAVLYPITVFDALQGFVEYGDSKAPCYLFNGSWFVFDKQYDALLTKEYKDLFDYNKTISDDLLSKWGLSHASATEANYNKWLSQRDDLQVSHEALIGNVEIADAIIFDDGNIFLMHNKDSFSGAGARDLTNQILSSAEYLSKHRFAYDARNFFESYYDKVVSKAKTEKRTILFTKTAFVDGFMNAKQIYYIAGYLKQYNRESDSTYAKYLSIELTQKLNQKGFGLIIIGLN